MGSGWPSRQAAAGRGAVWPQHVLAALGYAALAIVWTFPLVTSLSSHIPGPAVGDNVAFLWNFWWMRTALGEGRDFFYATSIFAPWGADLTLHTHTALPALAGATLLSGLSTVAALNVTVIASVALSGFFAYWLAWRATADRAGAALAGIVFGCSPFVAARLQGHFNLTHAWTIPLFAVAASEFVRSQKRGWGLLAGATLGATIYVDYYFVVFQVVLLGVLLVRESRIWSIGRADATRLLGVATGAALTATLVLFGVVGVIAATGGFEFRLGGVGVSAHRLFNPLQAAWLLLSVTLFLWIRPRISSVPRTGHGWRRATASAVVVLAVGTVIAGPLLWRAWLLYWGGDYVSQPVLWRSSPAGIDVATLLAGNPFHAIWGGSVRRVLDASGISAMESAGWLGVVPLALSALAIRHHADLEVVRRWSVLGGVFFVWSLGPHLMVLGHNVGLILPQAFVRYLPVLSNARMPGRAMVVVYLALAVLSAVSLARWRPAGRGRLLAAAVLASLVFIDYLPAPLPLTPLVREGVSTEIASRPEAGAVLELPLGLRDGFGVEGALNERILWNQTIHHRPLAGGFVARLPPSTRSAYHRDPLLSVLLTLSAGSTATAMPSREQAGEHLKALGIVFVVMDRNASPGGLREYVETVLPLTPIATADGGSLFLVARE